MIKTILSNLNGWQRIFVFVVLFLYLPLTIIALTDVGGLYVWKYSDVQLKEQVEKYLKKENISMTLTLAIKNPFYKYNWENAPLANAESIEIEFNSSDKHQRYLVTFNSSKEGNIFNDSVDVKKASVFLQDLIDSNKPQISSITINAYLWVLFIFICSSTFTYFLGFMIWWVKKGFQQSQR